MMDFSQRIMNLLLKLRRILLLTLVRPRIMPPKIKPVDDMDLETDTIKKTKSGRNAVEQKNDAHYLPFCLRIFWLLSMIT